MKKVYKILYALTFSIATLSLASCSEGIMDGINENENNPLPENVLSKFMITDIQNQLAINTSGGDLTFYAMSYIEHEVGIFSQLFNAEMRSAEPTSSTTYNNSWIGLYSNLEALKQMREKCSEGGLESGNNLNLGIAEVMTALYIGILADCYGDTPWSEALKIKDGIFQAKLDKQEAIYNDIFKFLDSAIANLSKESVGTPINSTQDMYYSVTSDKARAELWTKFAYSLKARYLMRLSHVDANYDAVLVAVEKGFTSASDEAKNSIFNGTARDTPYTAFFYSRNYMAASQSFTDKLDARQDPRKAEFISSEAITGSDEKYLNGYAPNGKPMQVQESYFLPSSAYDGAAPVYLMSYHELMFIKAEALLRKGDKVNAKVAMKTAILATFVKQSGTYDRILGVTTLTPDVAADYVDDKVNPLFDANALKELAIQKYIALYQGGESLEAYSDVRRNKAMNNDVYEFLNTGKFPLRYTYGNSDVTANNNIKDAYGDGQYVYTENVWWAGGTR